MARQADIAGVRLSIAGGNAGGPQGRAHYAVLALTEIALRDCASPVPLSDIARRHDLSLRYLEQIFVRLRRAGLVRSVRGPGGGYCLVPDARSVTIARIVAAVEPDCEDPGDSAEAMQAADCPVCRLWGAFRSHAERYLEQVSLADVVAGRIPGCDAPVGPPLDQAV